MTMYLPNRDVRPTGVEVAEFIDDPVLADDVRPPAAEAPAVQGVVETPGVSDGGAA
jgi:hypothetical protein